MPDISTLLPTSEFLQQLGVAAGIIVAFAVAARILLFFMGNIVHRITRSTNTKLDDMLVQSAKIPVFLLVVLFGVTVGLNQVTLSAEWQQFTNSVMYISYAAVFAVLTYRIIQNLLDWYLRERAKATETTLDEMLIPFLRRLLAIVLIGIVLALVLQHFNVPVTSFVATLGVGSLAVALAAQAVLADVISGFFVLLDQRYRIGDRIELVGEEVIGDVMDIGLRTTRILTMDHRVVIVPNSMIANRLVINHAYPDPKLRVDLPIGIAYGSDLKQVKALLIEAVQDVEGVYRDRKPDVVMKGFGDNGVELEMRCWINAFGDRPKMVDRINIAAYNALNAAGIEIPFPQRTIWHRIEPTAIENVRSAFTEQNGANGTRALPTNGNEQEAAIYPSAD